MGQNVTKVCMQPIHSFSPSATLSLSVVLDGQAEFAAVHHAADAQTQLQVFVRQPQQNLKKTATNCNNQSRDAAHPPPPPQHPTLTFPLLTFSEQLRMYMGMAMMTSSQACTVPALHWDMGLILASSTCWRRSRWSSEPSDRLRRVGLERLSESERGRRRGCEGVTGGSWARRDSRGRI